MAERDVFFFIGTEGGSGLKYNSLDDFLDGIREQVEQAFDVGYNTFEVAFTASDTEPEPE